MSDKYQSPTLALTFDDVSLVPQYSEILPSQVQIHTQINKNIALSVPILSSAMDSVTESAMAIAMAKVGGMGVIHKNLEPQKQADEVAKVKAFDQTFPCGAAVGPGADLEERAFALARANLDVFVMDTAHGHTKSVIEGVRKLREWFPNKTIIAGNIVTAKAAEALADAGVDAVKVGIGPGSICTTRVVAGVGVPQITAIMDVSRVTRARGIALIADGGIKFSGDIVKALAAGADAVMIGSLFAGTEEAPGEVELFQGRSYKVYRGMGSLGAMSQGSKDRYGQADVKESDKFVPEGIEGRIPYRGTLAANLYQLVGGLRSGMGYLGAPNLKALYENAQFVQVTTAGLRESHVHDVTITKEAPNYHSNL